MKNSELVAEFHKKFGFPLNDILAGHPSSMLSLQALMLGELTEFGGAQALAERGDWRQYRSCLIIEETRELLEAMNSGNRVEMADALGDLLYVVYGTAVHFGFPIDEIMAEIHRSNMTRERTDFRMRNKGANFSPPNLENLCGNA